MLLICGIHSIYGDSPTTSLIQIMFFISPTVSTILDSSSNTGEKNMMDDVVAEVE